MTGVAVNDTDAPGHTEVVFVAMVTEGVTAELIVIVMALDVAVVGDAQLAVEVMTHVTTAPVVSVVVVNVALLVPALVPFTFH